MTHLTQQQGGNCNPRKRCPSLSRWRACMPSGGADLNLLPSLDVLSKYKFQKKIQIIQRRLLSSSQGPQNAAMTHLLYTCIHL